MCKQGNCLSLVTASRAGKNKTKGIFMSELKKRSNENIKQYKIRLFENKEIYGLNYKEITQLINSETGETLAESTHRGWYKNYSEGRADGIAESMDKDNVMREYRIEQEEIYKQKTQLRDQRNDLNNRLRKVARNEHVYELLVDAISNSSLPILEFKEHRNLVADGDELIIPLSDAHYGLTIDNEFEKYNPDVFVKRLENYYNQIIEIKSTHNISKCHVAMLGDLISGNIHYTIAVSNKENVIDQTKHVSEYIAQFLAKLSGVFPEVEVYYVSGNHSRVNPNKHDAINAERLENFIPWYLEARLAGFGNVNFNQSILDNTVAKANVNGNLVYFAHGDKDSPSRIAENLTMMFDQKPKMVMFGHMHHFELNTKQKVKLVMSGSFCVNDEYCTDKRIIGEPSQTVCVMGSRGMKCAYDCVLN